MGSFDCYCALCAGPLTIYSVGFGLSDAKSLGRRRRKIERRRDLRKRKLAGEDVDENEVSSEDDDEMEDAPAGANDDTLPESSEGSDYEPPSSSPPTLSEDSESTDSADSEPQVDNTLDVSSPPSSESEKRFDDSWSQAEDLQIAENFDFEAGDDSYSYDPERLHSEDTLWLDRCRCLALNSKVTEAFFSGRGRYNDYGDFEVEKPGADPNDTGEEHYCCHGNFGQADVSYGFPAHEACFQILARCLGYKDYKGLDKDVLHSVFENNSQDLGNCLSLSYDIVSENEQFWTCFPGAEVSLWIHQSSDEVTDETASTRYVIQDHDQVPMQYKAYYPLGSFIAA
jgi:hypothetical protein